MELFDNDIKSISDGAGDYLWMSNFANRTLLDLEMENPNLMVFPTSLKSAADDLGRQSLFQVSMLWNDCVCAKLTVKTGNVAGFIGYGDDSISINSRFSKGEDGVAMDDFFLQYMLLKVCSVNMLTLRHSTSRERVFDYLLFFFPMMLRDALSQGLYKEYKRHEYNDANIRGFVDVNRHIRHNIPFNAKVAYSTREFCYDNNITELIRHTIEYIDGLKDRRTILHNNTDIQASVSQIIRATATYRKSERQSVIKNNLKVFRHPYFTKYAQLQKLCLQILRHDSMKYAHGCDKVYGILFDVAWLWESYLATIFTERGYHHPDNLKGTGRIFLSTLSELPRYPDFYKENPGGPVLDAKYKKEIDKRDDVNQMITYMYCLKAMRGVLIHPSLVSANGKKYLLKGYGEELQASLKVYEFRVPMNAKDFEEFVEGMEGEEERICRYCL